MQFLPSVLTQKIFGYLTHCQKEKVKGHLPFSQFTFEAFVEGCLRGTVTDKSHFLFNLSSPEGEVVSAQNLYQVGSILSLSHYYIYLFEKMLIRT